MAAPALSAAKSAVLLYPAMSPVAESKASKAPAAFTASLTACVANWSHLSTSSVNRWTSSRSSAGARSRSNFVAEIEALHLAVRAANKAAA